MSMFFQVYKLYEGDNISVKVNNFFKKKNYTPNKKCQISIGVGTVSNTTKSLCFITPKDTVNFKAPYLLY